MENKDLKNKDFEERLKTDKDLQAIKASLDAEIKSAKEAGFDIKSYWKEMLASLDK